MDKPLDLPPQQPVGELTWIAGGGVDAQSVSLRFFGDDLDPNIITNALGIRPAHSYKKGDPISDKNYHRCQTTGSWRYKTPKYIDLDLESIINNLFDRLTPDIEIWQELATQFDADILCGVWLQRSNGTIDFSPQLTRRITDRGLRISLDIYLDRDDIKADF